MRKKNLNELKFKKEIISKLAIGTIIGGGSSSDPEELPQSFNEEECYWSKGNADASNAFC